MVRIQSSVSMSEIFPEEGFVDAGYCDRFLQVIVKHDQ